MHVCHEGKNPNHGVAGGLLEAFPGAGLAAVADSIELHAVMGESTFVWREPFRGEWKVW